MGNQRCILIDMRENQKYSNNTARRNFPPLVLYKKNQKSLLTSWLTFLLLYNCSVKHSVKTTEEIFFLALFSNFNQQQQQLLKKNYYTILFLPASSVFVCKILYEFPLSFSQKKDDYTMAMISPMFH